MRVTPLSLLFVLLSTLACSPSSSLTSPSNSAGSQSRTTITAKEAVSRAGSFASGWASDAVLFAVIGVERRSPTTKTPAGMQPKDDQGARQFPCGPIDAATWEMFDPAFEGAQDDAAGDGRVTAWQAVYYSFSRDMGISVLVRPEHDLACAADPLTAEDRAQLKNLRLLEWRTDSTEAMAAVRAMSETLDRALSASSNAQVSYGFDLREGSSWGIKGRAPDQGVSFFGRVSLTSPTVTSLEVTPNRPTGTSELPK